MTTKRFSFDEERIAGYWRIEDKENEDEPIWVDCPKDFIKFILNGLNKMGEKKKIKRKTGLLLGMAISLSIAIIFGGLLYYIN